MCVCGGGGLRYQNLEHVGGHIRTQVLLQPSLVSPPSSVYLFPLGLCGVSFLLLSLLGPVSAPYRLSSNTQLYTRRSSPVFSPVQSSSHHSANIRNREDLIHLDTHT